MTHRSNNHVLFTSVSLLALVLAGCCSKKKEEPPPSLTPAAAAAAAAGATAGRVVSVEPGVAGGSIAETTTAAATVADLDKDKRTVTLTTEAGNKATFTAGPEIRNFDQLKKGDKVTATLHQRLDVYVRSDVGSGGEAGDAYGAALTSTPKGAMPGAIVAENYQVVATVSEIDRAKRVATLTFADGSKRNVNVRDDVDLSRYVIGDRLIIRVNSTLFLLASRP